MDDLISRQAVKDAINEHHEFVTSRLGNDSEVKKIYIMAYNHVIDAISILPAIQPEQKTGRWIDNTVAFYRECSECGALVTNRMEKIFLHLEGKKLNYCSNCGAKMEVKE